MRARQSVSGRLLPGGMRLIARREQDTSDAGASEVMVVRVRTCSEFDRLGAQGRGVGRAIKHGSP